MSELREFFSQFSSINRRLHSLEDFKSTAEGKLSQIEDRIQAIIPAIQSLEGRLEGVSNEARGAAQTVQQGIMEINAILSETNKTAQNTAGVVSQLKADTAHALEVSRGIEATLADTSAKLRDAQEKVTAAQNYASVAMQQASNAAYDANQKVGELQTNLMVMGDNFSNSIAIMGDNLRGQIGIAENKVADLNAKVDAAGTRLQAQIDALPTFETLKPRIEEIVNGLLTTAKTNLENTMNNMILQAKQSFSNEITSVQALIQSDITQMWQTQVMPKINAIEPLLARINEYGGTEFIRQLSQLTTMIAAYGDKFVVDLTAAATWVRDKGTSVWTSINSQITSLTSLWGKTKTFWSVSRQRFEDSFNILKTAMSSVYDSFVLIYQQIVNDAKITSDWAQVLYRDRNNALFVAYNTYMTIMSMNWSLNNLKMRLNKTQEAFGFLGEASKTAFSAISGLPTTIETVLDNQTATPLTLPLAPVLKQDLRSFKRTTEVSLTTNLLVAAADFIL